MAAPAEPIHHTAAEVRDLREFRASDLQPMLEACEREWLETLHWDFSKSADLVRKFVDMGNLNGFVLVTARGIIGYTYFVFEEGKGLLGDLYLLPEYRIAAFENWLMNCAMDQIAGFADIRRVEAQIMMLSAPLGRRVSGWPRYEVFRRGFLSLALRGVMEAQAVPPQMIFEPWTPAFQEEAARLIPATYVGHIDSRINDQYQSVAGARKFLSNIMQFPGCGDFQAASSLAVFDRESGRMCGMVLSSLVSPRSGHITQVCVHPNFQQAGLGRELLRRALALLMRQGCTSASLTVTAENSGARVLYERLGFRVAREFAAYVWEA